MTPEEIQELANKREELETRKSRLLGKHEAAQTASLDIDQQLRDLGVDPKIDLDEELARLKKERDEKIASFVKALDEAEKIITTIEDRISNL